MATSSKRHCDLTQCKGELAICICFHLWMVAPIALYDCSIILDLRIWALGRYSIYTHVRELETWPWSANVKNQTNDFPLYVLHIGVSATWTWIYDMWPWTWNRSQHVAIFHVHAQHSLAKNKNKKTSFYARGNRETNWIHRKCPVLHMNSL